MARESNNKQSRHRHLSDYLHAEALATLLKSGTAWWRVSENTRLLVLSGVVGLGTGFGAVFFIWLVEWARGVFFGLSPAVLSGYEFYGWRWWVPLIPALGGLIVGPIVYNFAHEAKGHGVPEVMDAVALKGGVIRPRVAAAKAIASAICIGSGGSAGREGPIVQIGSAIGSVVGQWFRMSAGRIKVLVGCGAAAGIAAVFNAPIAGVIFSLEVILGDFAVRTFSPVIFSSVAAAVVSRAFIGDNPAFSVPAYSLISAWEIPLYIILGTLAGVFGRLFTATLYKGEDLFDGLDIPGWIKPAIGGMMLGMFGLFLPQVFADGYSSITQALYGQMTAWVLVVLVFAKIIATTFTLGSGNSGGIFAPSLFIGAMLGGAFGTGVHTLWPNVTAGSGAYALVGMGALVAGATHAPITALLIIFEMTSDYRIILPLMVACVSSTLIAHRLSPHSIYTLKLARRGIVLRGGRDVNVLAGHKVAEVMRTDLELIPAHYTVPEILKRMETTQHSAFAVVDGDGHMIGTIGFEDLREVVTKPDLGELIIASDLAHPEPDVVTPQSNLAVALDRFGPRGISFMPVVDEHDPRKPVGRLIRDDVVQFYNRRLVERLQGGPFV